MTPPLRWSTPLEQGEESPPWQLLSDDHQSVGLPRSFHTHQEIRGPAGDVGIMHNSDLVTFDTFYCHSPVRPLRLLSIG